MKAAIVWIIPAFAQLEELPPQLAFEIVHRVDLLADFQEMGASLHSRYPALQNCRQLIISRAYRVIYELMPENVVSILAVQHCRRELPSARELKWISELAKA